MDVSNKSPGPQFDHALPVIRHDSRHYEEIDLPYPVERVFDLVADIERYPDFLPGWRSVKVKGMKGEKIFVQQEIGFPLLEIRLDTAADLHRPHSLDVVVTRGAFKGLAFEWRFDSIAPAMTRLSLLIKSDTPPQQQPFIDQLLHYASGSLLDYFERRAEKLFRQ